ncbi:type 2 lanthipeptide synthetase LanM [Streptomyces caelestis]|jgi:type 2 lantibiotic biosynthesis protein LanM|uniref:Type 2 lantibiotic biosynthesis protein LanM n=1 Tax=Streptomyces caelestis TaxID=36816 RepID=A0A7W9H6Z9_9ACTN|nr:type 2 lanthipeptide synthetase LanM [Streptomyces caelestis]MBB5796621.1 type 2 lantibiotic biosynthesis protein LanM [Streptomyces caelestis]GGW40050.1 hypothetical protein GCM10010320_19350 [Streptomyces caelestis]
MTGPDVTIPAFLPFYTELIPRDRVRDRLGDLVAATAAPEHVDPLLDQVWEDLVGTVEGHAFRMLIGEFHTFREQRGLPMTTEGDEALQQFRQHLRDAAGRGILDGYPVLRERLETVLRNSLDAYADLFAAYARDRATLFAAGLLPSAEATVAELFATGADLHNDNRQVVGVRLADGSRIVFKPRPLVSDAFVRDLYAAADPHLKHSLRGCVPDSVTVGSHGWQQFVTPGPMDDPEQPARYFYRFGALCALLGAIGASDLHEENLLAAGEHPCVIDTETMVRPNAGVDNDSLPHLLINQLKLSVVSTMLVPMANPNSPIDLNMAGVGVEGEQTSKMRRPVIRDTGTDGIRIVWENVTYRHKNNVPRLDGTALSPVDHFADILEGCTDALAAVRDERLAKVLDTYPDMPVRVLIRSTMVYSRFLDAATHPDYLGRPEEAERIFRLLGKYPDYLTPEAAAYVGEQERAGLHTGNVPYFVARGGSTELATPGSRFPGVHRTSPLDFARCGLEVNARRSDAFHRFLLEECFGEIAAGDRPGGLCRHSVFAGALDGGTPRERWTRIARTIASVGVSYDGPDGPQTGWVCGIGPDRSAPTVTPGNFISFHDTGGIVAFLANAAHHDPGLRDAHRAADRGFDALLAEYGALLLEVPEGVFTGAASLLLARPNGVDRHWLEQVLDKIDERAAVGTLDADLANGPAGLLMLLLSRLESGEAPLVGAERLDRLRQLTLAQAGRPLTGFHWYDVAHGDLGLRWAASRAGRVLGDTEPARRSADWLAGRLAEGDEPPVPGWCNGAAGLLLTAAEILVSAGRQELLSGGRLDRLADRATRLPEDGPVDLSVCHGSSGVVQSLVAAGRLLGDDRLLDRAIEYQERVTAVARSRGFHTSAVGRTSLLGYMFGWAGVGDTEVLLHAVASGTGGPAVPVALMGPAPHTTSPHDVRSRTATGEPS